MGIIFFRCAILVIFAGKLLNAPADIPPSCFVDVDVVISETSIAFCFRRGGRPRCSTSCATANVLRRSTIVLLLMIAGIEPNPGPPPVDDFLSDDDGSDASGVLQFFFHGVNVQRGADLTVFISSVEFYISCYKR